MFEYREMCAADAEGVAQVEERCFAIPWSRETFWQEASKQTAHYLVAQLEDKIVAYIGMWIVADEGQITNVAVLPEYRRQGIGKKLLEKMLLFARQKQLEAITLEVRISNEPARLLLNGV